MHIKFYSQKQFLYVSETSFIIVSSQSPANRKSGFVTWLIDWFCFITLFSFLWAKTSAQFYSFYVRSKCLYIALICESSKLFWISLFIFISGFDTNVVLHRSHIFGNATPHTISRKFPNRKLYSYLNNYSREKEITILGALIEQILIV